eukprot:GILI01047374.1.p1 GENE.GILI01047374.1~~GILI01047374.1.p1  ORF type:complete len:106 (+),score=15.16 GILI01047374.1:38-355(+)
MTRLWSPALPSLMLLLSIYVLSVLSFLPLSSAINTGPVIVASDFVDGTDGWEVRDAGVMDVGHGPPGHFAHVLYGRDQYDSPFSSVTCVLSVPFPLPFPPLHPFP